MAIHPIDVDISLKKPRNVNVVVLHEVLRIHCPGVMWLNVMATPSKSYWAASLWIQVVDGESTQFSSLIDLFYRVTSLFFCHACDFCSGTIEEKPPTKVDLQIIWLEGNTWWSPEGQLLYNDVFRVPLLEPHPRWWWRPQVLEVYSESKVFSTSYVRLYLHSHCL